MNADVSAVVARLQDEVVGPLKNRFVGRDEVVDLVALAIVSGEHLFLHGPPGTAKSALIRGFAESVHGHYFEYLLTRFSEPNEIFGPIDLAKLRDGVVSTVTTSMLPEAEFAFLDELFNANSAILNNLLTILNERLYRRGSEVRKLPLLSLFSASNSLPEDEALRALFDRFLIRCHVDSLSRSDLPRLLSAGWEIETAAPISSRIATADLKALSQQVFSIDLTGVSERYAEVVGRVRDLGITLSDRRAVKTLKLIAGSAVLCGRSAAIVADFWPLRYCWDREEQIGPLRSLVDAILKAEPAEAKAHPLARVPDRVDPEELARSLESAKSEIEKGSLSLVAIARLRERLIDLADKSAWVTKDSEREYLRTRAHTLLQLLAEKKSAF